MKRLHNTPLLQIDKQIAAIRREPLNLSADAKLERRIVATLCAHLRAAGWNVSSVWDGDEENAVATAAAALEIIFNLDESLVRFTKITPNGSTTHAVYLVCGNGCDIISDWHYADGDADGFGAAMDAFSAAYGDAIDAADVRAHDERLRNERQRHEQTREWREQNPEADYDAADRVAFESEKIANIRQER